MDGSFPYESIGVKTNLMVILKPEAENYKLNGLSLIQI